LYKKLTNEFYSCILLLSFGLIYRTFKGRRNLNKESIAARLTSEVVERQAPEEAIVSLQGITAEIIDSPGVLLDEDFNKLYTSIRAAQKRVSSISPGVLKRVISRHNFGGDPKDWVDSVLELRIFKRQDPVKMTG